MVKFNHVWVITIRGILVKSILTLFITVTVRFFGVLKLLFYNKAIDLYICD